MRCAAISTVLVAALALAGCAGGGGTSNVNSASDFTGEQKLVANIVEDLQSAAEDSDERKICGSLLVAELRDAIAAKNKAATCTAALEKGLKDTDQADLTVKRVVIDGDTATVVVQAKLGDDARREQVVGLAKVAGAWKISKLPS